MNELLRRILFLPPQASTVAREIDSLHYFVIVTTMAGATAITGVGLYFVIRYRARGRRFRREDPKAVPPLWAELAVVGGLLGLFCLWWVIGFVQFVRLQVVPEDAIDVYVTGKQWMWKFAYPDGQHSVSALVVPTGRPVRLLLTSRDVIHSFFVPDFRIKQDALPGRYTTAWFTVREPGTHPVFCTEYCGVSHSTMRAQVVALSPGDYSRWLGGTRFEGSVRAPPPLTAGAPGTLDVPSGIAGPRDLSPATVEAFAPAELLDLVRLGREVAAQQGCLRCHTLDGSPYIGPTWAALYDATIPLSDGGSVRADPAYLTQSMMDPLARIHEGFPPVMPSYQGLLSPAQTAAILELMKSLRDVPARPAEPDLPLRLTPEEPGLPPPAEMGLPPPGLTPNPPPRGRIRAVAPRAQERPSP